eukprot:TRINITY_DN2381_c0_g1_i1.p1 TRINITY_DN2381_c0_g1~~TRINITY_DN2381_c0_g1_i1.p1  ORF type:complete len:202 (+),score=49.27 TRINITY_DN2381_c0_g1_i1:52-657(+)
MGTLEKFTKKLESDTCTYKYQAIWFLNAFWADLENQEALAENLWDLVAQFEEIFFRVPKGNNANALDMLGAARLLELRGETMTANARRDMLKELDVDNDKMMSLWEYLIHLWADQKPFKGKGIKWTLEELMTRPQGTNQALVDAKESLNAVNAALDDFQAKKRKYQKAIDDNEGKVVKQNRAKNQLAQLEPNNLMTDVKFK